MPSDTYTLVIADAGVSTPADGSVTTGKIANLAVTTAKLETSSNASTGVTTIKIADSAVTTAKLVDSSSTTTGVTTAKIADDAVTTAKILNLAVTTAKLESYSSGSTGVTTAKIADLAVTTAKLADGAVTDVKITNGTITDAKLATISTAGKVTNNATTAASINTLSAIVARDGSGNFSAGIITAALTGNATTATSIAGGTAGAIPYQTGAGTTQFTNVGTAGQLLVSNGTAAPTWGSAVGGVSGGGTGIYSYAVGDIIYANGQYTLTKLAAVATGNVLLSGGVTTAPFYGPVPLDTHVSGTLPVIRGGTGFTQSAYGEYYISTATATTPIVDGVYIKVAGTTTAGSFLSNFTHTSGNKLTYTGTTRKFLVSATISFSGTNGNIYKFAFHKGSTLVASSPVSAIVTGGSHMDHVSCQCIVELDNTNFIEVFVTNVGAANPVTVNFMNVSAIALI